MNVYFNIVENEGEEEEISTILVCYYRFCKRLHPNDFSMFALFIFCFLGFFLEIEKNLRSMETDIVI